MSEARRAAFENSVARDCFDQTAPSHLFNRYEDGTYRNEAIRLRWYGYTAALSSPEVKALVEALHLARTLCYGHVLTVVNEALTPFTEASNG